TPGTQSWKDHRVAQTVGGYLAGLALGLVPGGGVGAQVLTLTGVLPSGTRHAQIGRAVGEMMGGVILMVAGTGGSIGGGIVSASGIGAAIGVPAAAVSAGLVTAGAGNFASGLAGLGRALSTGSGSGAGTSAGPAAPQGQVHHPISKRIHQRLDTHNTLTGKYTSRDPRFETRAANKASHNGYQKWHRDIENEVIEWLDDHPTASPDSFEAYLRELYSRPDLRARFPDGL
ncbi:MAG: hypothetical protein L6Q76_38750, partial [Polyangiaceae bacterium]|nr:hypothetical protein [Polyangiaceae bacterium]